MKIDVIATIYPKNLRDSRTLSPKVLLQGIEGFERDYLWCGDKKLIRYINKYNITKPTKVSFKANVYDYKNSKLEIKEGLKDISHITIL